MEIAASPYAYSYPPAFTSVARRLFWKELRSLRGLAIGIVILAMFAMAALAWLSPDHSETAVLLGTAFAATAMFAIGASVILFSAERDDGTIALLQLLPKSPAGVLIGKLSAAVVMMTVVLAILLGAGIVAQGFRVPDSTTLSEFAVLGVVFLVEAFAWGILVSIMCPNPLLAAVLGIAAASISPQIAMQFSIRPLSGFNLQDYIAATVPRLALAAVAGALDIWLGLRWLNRSDSSLKLLSWSTRTASHHKVNSVAAAPHLNLRPNWLRTFTPLCWQTLRQSWKAILAAMVIGLLLTITVHGVWMQFARLPFIQECDLPFTLLFVPALVGALTFRADQRNRQYRFLAEHAGRPRMMWAARQFVGMAVVVTIGIVIHVFLLWQLRKVFAVRLDYQLGVVDAQWTQAAQTQLRFLIEYAEYLVFAGWAAWLTAYALGQLSSLTLRSPVLAAMVSLGASIIVLLWTYVVVAWRLSPLLFLIPVMFAALAATWLRVKDWQADRNALVRWIVPATVLIVPVIVMFCSVPSARLAQVADEMPTSANIDSVERLSLQGFCQVAESELEAGRQILDKYGELVIDWNGDALLSNQELDERLIALSREVCRLPASANASERWLNDILTYVNRRFDRLVELNLDDALEMLLARARLENQRQGGWPAWRLADEWQSAKWTWAELPPSWLKWVTAEGQTADRVKRALRELREIDRQRPTLADGIVNSYLAARRVIRGEDSPSFFHLAADDRRLEQWLAFLAHGIPGEQARAEKALDLLAREALDFAYRIDWTNHTNIGGTASAVAYSMASWRAQLRRYHWHFEESSGVTPYTFVMDARSSNINSRWPSGQQLRLNMAAQTSYFAVQEFNVVRELSRYTARAVADVARRHAERTGLALIAYRLEHGKYPEFLDDLQPNYLTSVEISDPYAAAPLQYRREGFPWACVLGELPNSMLIEPRTPLVWSIGPGRVEPVERDQWVGRTAEGAYFLGDRNTINSSAVDFEWKDKAIFLTGMEHPADTGVIVLTLPVE
jgi:hypothetical protein